jgi:hypothetical protein
MKKVIFLIAVITCIHARSFAQTSTSMEPIMKLGLEFVKGLEEKYPGVIVLKAEFDYAFDDNLTYFDFSEKLDYIVASVGDEKVADVTLVIYKKVDGAWVEVKKDMEHKNSALLEIEPSTTGEYAIDVKVTKFKDSNKTGHVGLFVLVQSKK